MMSKFSHTNYVVEQVTVLGYNDSFSVYFQIVVSVSSFIDVHTNPKNLKVIYCDKSSKNVVVPENKLCLMFTCMNNTLK